MLNIAKNLKEGGMHMPKKFNLSSKSDMKRFMKELEKQVYSNAEKEVLSRKYEVECPSY